MPNPLMVVPAEKIGSSLQPVIMAQNVIVLLVAPAVHQVVVMVLRHVRTHPRVVSIILMGNTFVNVQAIVVERVRSNVRTQV